MHGDSNETAGPPGHKERSSKRLRYTCADYRDEMTLVGLRRRLQHGELTEKEKQELASQIRRLEARMELD